jgi:hypothetical protein
LDEVAIPGAHKGRSRWQGFSVWDGEHLVDNGSIPDRCSFEDKHIYKSLGSFAGAAGKKYIVKVITKEGTPLNVANPHLIVIQHRNFW